MDPTVNGDITSNGVVFTDLSSNGVVLTKVDHNTESTKFPVNDLDHEKGPPSYSESGEKLYPHLHENEDYWGRKSLLNDDEKFRNNL